MTELAPRPATFVVQGYDPTRANNTPEDIYTPNFVILATEKFLERTDRMLQRHNSPFNDEEKTVVAEKLRTGEALRTPAETKFLRAALRLGDARWINPDGHFLEHHSIKDNGKQKVEAMTFGQFADILDIENTDNPSDLELFRKIAAVRLNFRDENSMPPFVTTQYELAWENSKPHLQSLVGHTAVGWLTPHQDRFETAAVVLSEEHQIVKLASGQNFEL